MLYLIGIGLGGLKDITLKGLELVRKANAVYLEGYTSLLQCTLEDLERFYQKSIKILKRIDVEDNLDSLLEEAKEKDIALLIIGDVFAATTHLAILERASECIMRAFLLLLGLLACLCTILERLLLFLFIQIMLRRLTEF